MILPLASYLKEEKKVLDCKVYVREIMRVDTEKAFWTDAYNLVLQVDILHFSILGQSRVVEVNINGGESDSQDVWGICIYWSSLIW